MDVSGLEVITQVHYICKGECRPDKAMSRAVKAHSLIYKTLNVIATSQVLNISVPAFVTDTCEVLDLYWVNFTKKVLKMQDIYKFIESSNELIRKSLVGKLNLDGAITSEIV